jgi:hypothetical protein
VRWETSGKIYASNGKLEGETTWVQDAVEYAIYVVVVYTARNSRIAQEQWLTFSDSQPTPYQTRIRGED